jgi:hypothetical protein
MSLSSHSNCLNRSREEVVHHVFPSILDQRGVLIQGGFHMSIGGNLTQQLGILDATGSYVFYCNGE